jgi:hypothetical protein
MNSYWEVFLCCDNRSPFKRQRQQNFATSSSQESEGGDVCCETGRFLNSRPLSTRRPVTESYHSRITETKKASHMSKKRIWIADELLRQFQGCKDVSKVWRTRSTGVSHTGPFSPIPLDVGVCLRADCAPNESLKPLPGPKTFPMDSLLPSMLARYLQ